MNNTTEPSGVTSDPMRMGSVELTLLVSAVTAEAYCVSYLTAYAIVLSVNPDWS